MPITDRIRADRPPLILGHEAAGVVASGPRAGERVAINPLVIAAECAFIACAERSHLSPTRQLLSMPPWPGAFAEYVRVPALQSGLRPRRFELAHAALTEPHRGFLPRGQPRRAASLHAHFRLPLRRARRRSDRCCGCALVLAMQGAAEIHISEPNAQRRATAARAGPFTCYAPGEATSRSRISADLVIDAVGAAATRAAASRMVSTRRRHRPCRALARP